MNIVQRITGAFKSTPEVQVHGRSSEERDFWQQFGGIYGPNNVSSAMTVTEESSWRLAPVSQAIQLISQEVATLPLNVFRRDGEDRELAPLHPAQQLLRWSPNHLFTSWKWRETAMINTLLFGNSVTEILRDSMGRPRALWNLEPWRIQFFHWEATGSEREIVYVYTPLEGGQRRLLPEDVLHIRAMDSRTGLWGQSPVLRCADAIGLTAEAQAFATAFFNNGTTLSGILEHPGSLSEEGFRSLKNAWDAAHKGPLNQRGVAILEDGLSWKPTAVPPEEGQMLETREHQVREVARIFNLPVHRLNGSTGDSLTYTTETQERQAFYSMSIRPWLTQWEAEIKLKLLSRNFEADFDMAEALRADIKTRYDSHAVALASGWKLPNEVRIEEGLSPIPGLDDDPEPVVPVETELEVEVDPEPAPDPRSVLEGAAGRVVRFQVKAAPEINSDGKLEAFWIRQRGVWVEELGPILEFLGADEGLAEELALRFVTQHRRDVEAGVPDLELAWSAADITQEIVSCLTS